MKVKLYLHGHLKDKVKQSFVEVEGDTLLDVLRNFELQYRSVLKAPLDVGKWRIRVKDFEVVDSWKLPLTVNEIYVYPDFRMGKSQRTAGWVQTGIGVALIIAGVAIGIAASWTGVGGTVGVSMIMTGISLLAQGILTLFFTPTNETESTNSKYLGAGGNTTKSGTRIPIGYGLFKISGQILSYNVSSSNLKIYKGS